MTVCLGPREINHERASCAGAAGSGFRRDGSRILFDPCRRNPASVGLRSSLKAGGRRALGAPQKGTKRHAQTRGCGSDPVRLVGGGAVYGRQR